MIDELLQELDSCIEQGRTLSAHWYFEEDVLKLERELVFKPSWQLVTETAKLDEPGDFQTETVGSVPIMLVRGRDKELRGFVNVCRHRGHLVASGCGNRATLQCPYHAWTYGLDGKLRAAPRSEAEADFDLEDYPLLPIQVAEWGPILLVNLDPGAPSFEQTFAELLTVSAERGLDLSEMTLRSTEPWEFKCNWKVFYDNSAECYHCSTVHPSFAKGYGVSSTDYLLESHDEFVYHRSPLKEKVEGVSAEDWQMYSVWPNWSIATGTNSLVAFVYSFSPIDAQRTRIVTHTVAAPSISDRTAAEEMDWWRRIVLGEDRLACESVQRGLASNQVRNGPLLLNSEHIIQRFQRRLRDAFSGRAPAYVA
jgi:phenylpropionate dioxygenase-like ring-hydroxylating dioxygenase large terminal subunit